MGKYQELRRLRKSNMFRRNANVNKRPIAIGREKYPMSLKFSYSTLGWRNPDLEPALTELKAAGWDGWECRLPLDWLGSPNRLRRVCENTGMPMVVYTASGSPDSPSAQTSSLCSGTINRDWAHTELNKRRMEYAAEMEADCFMFMNGGKPADRPVNEDDIKAAVEAAEV